MKTTTIKAPAKINLSLDVLHKREDGYHEVKMVMTQVDLSDRIDLKSRLDGKVTVEMSAGYIPVDKRNLAYQAATLLQQRCNVKQGVSLYIHKHIPVAAGLAGGSTDAAATLKGCNDIWGLGLSISELAEIGSEIGSDVAFCVYGGTALATGRGEKITPIDSPPPCWVVLAKPPIGVSTGEIYQQLDLSKKQSVSSDEMIEAVTRKDYQSVCALLHNSLEKVTLDIHPEVGRIKKCMTDAGVDAALMSGSGPTVFGLVRKESRVNRVYNSLRGFCEEVYAVRLITDDYLNKSV